ncbi:hypothetical protein [Streptomyces sp. NPDC006274]|uniref:hypothetical protein n=1 Tax=unclassified Streptomyces TaxID=2593676 RepID=UPI0033A041A8
MHAWRTPETSRRHVSTGRRAGPGSAPSCWPTRCTWLTDHDYGRLKVNGGDDPLRLDPNRDGVACGKGDVRGR